MKTFDQEKLLIVEDEPSLRRLYSILVNDNFPGVSVDSVFDGVDAVDHFAQQQPGTILLDMNLPVLDGLTTCQHMHKICRCRGWDLPNMIICSASIKMQDRLLISQLNPSPTVLAKPVANRALINTLQLAFDKALPQL